MIVVIVNGKPRSGKTSFETEFSRYANDNHKFKTEIYSYATLAKEYLQYLQKYVILNPIDKIPKDERNRIFLAEITDIIDNYCEAPIKDFINKYKSSKNIKDLVVFFDIRRPDKIRKAKELLEKEDIDVVTILLRRPTTDMIEHEHEVDSNIVYDYDYDYVFSCDTIDELHFTANCFVDILKERI